MKVQQLSQPAANNTPVRKVSLAEARWIMQTQDVQELPMSAGFWMPALPQSNIGIMFPNLWPLDYDGQVICPNPTATSRNDAELTRLLGFHPDVYVEIWSGQFDFESQCFQLTLPERASSILMYILYKEHAPFSSISLYAKQYQAMLCQSIQVPSKDGNQKGYAIIQSTDGFEEILLRHGQNYQERLARAIKTMQLTAAQRETCKKIMANLMTHAELLGWGWQPMSDRALIFYLTPWGEAKREFWDYVPRDVNALRDLICIAEETSIKWRKPRK